MKLTYFSYSSTPSTNPSSLQIVKTCEAFSYNNMDIELVVPNTGLKNFSLNFYYNIKNMFKLTVIESINKFPRGFNFYKYSLRCLLIAIKKRGSVSITRNFFLSFLLSIFNKSNILEIHHDICIEGRLTKFLIKSTNFLNNSNIIKIIAISSNVKKLFVEKYGVSEKKIKVLPSGNLNSSYRRNYIQNSKKLNIGYFGSLSSSKGIDTIIKLSKLDTSNNYFIFGGKIKDIFKLKLKNINKNLYLYPALPYRNVFNKMYQMDVLLMPYKKVVKSSGEVDNIAEFTSPLKLFDYLSCGKVVISSNLNVLHEVLSSKNCIFIDNYNNINSWFIEINKIKNLNTKRTIINKNNYFLSKKYSHYKRVKHYL